MYCNRCGTANPDDAVYCKKCGSLLEAEDETRVAARGPGPSIRTAAGEGGELVFAINPTLKFVSVGYLLAVIVSFAVTLLAGVLAGFTPAGTVALGLAICLAMLLVPVYFHVRQKLIRYVLKDTMIEIDRGLLSRSTQHIPLRRVQDVTVTATLMQRMLGYGDITIDNASEDGGKVVLDNVDSPRKYADLILRRMRDLDR